MLDKDPWTGGVADNNFLIKTFTREKGMKARTLIFKLEQDIEDNPNRGFSFKFSKSPLT